jgi:hypothetical protein
MGYDQQILRILSEVGERGISVSFMAKHVYNQNCTLFSQPDFREIHQYVQQYLLRNSKSEQSLIQRTEKRGYYRLNTQNSPMARQLLLDFREEEDEEVQEKEKPVQDFSLDLFSGI